MKYYIEEYKLLLNLEGWSTIKKFHEEIDGEKKYTIIIEFKNRDNRIEDMYYWDTENERNKTFDEINQFLK